MSLRIIIFFAINKCPAVYQQNTRTIQRYDIFPDLATTTQNMYNPPQVFQPSHTHTYTLHNHVL